MLNTILRGILTLVFAWFLAVVVDRVMTRVTSVVWSVLRRRKTAPATN